MPFCNKGCISLTAENGVEFVGDTRDILLSILPTFVFLGFDNPDIVILHFV